MGHRGDELKESRQARQREMIAEEMRRYALANEHWPTSRQWEAHASLHDMWSLSTLIRIFGTYSQAVQAAKQ